MDDSSYTRTLQLSGRWADAFGLELEAGRRTRLTVQDLDARGDGDWLSLQQVVRWPLDGPLTGRIPPVDVSAGQAGSMVLHSDSDATVELRLAGPRGHRVAVTVETLGPDDHGDSAGTATPAAIGQPVAVHIDADGDRDVLVYDLKAGERVVFDADTPSVDLQLVHPWGGPPTWGHGALVDTPWMDGRYALVLTSNGGTSPIDAVVAARVVADDLGEQAVHTTALQLGEAVADGFAGPADTDLFWLEAPPGLPVQVRLQSAEIVIAELREGAGQWVRTVYGQDAEAGVTELRFDVPEDGIVALELTAGGYAARDYELIATPVAADDHAPDIGHATPIAIGQTVQVQGDGLADADTLRWATRAGERYRIHVELSEQARGWALLEAGQVERPWESPIVGWSQGRSVFDGGLTASVAGQAWLQLTDLRQGSAAVTVWAVAPDDHADVLDAATPLPLHEPATAVADAGFDRDWFRWSGAPGDGVRLTLRPTDDSASWLVTLHVHEDRDMLAAGWQLELGPDGIELPPLAIGDDGQLWLMVESSDAHPHGYVVTGESVALGDPVADHGVWPSLLTGLPDPMAFADRDH